MPTPANLEKAKLFQIDWVEDEVELRDPSSPVPVQFNPETLTVNYANKTAGGDQRGGSALQYVGQGTTKLSLELWFDVTGEQPEGVAETDVRKLTEKVIAFIKPQKEGEGDQTKYKIPGMRFIWGSFIFDGVVESISEKLELFSEDGRPLRAQVSLSLSNQSFQLQIGERNRSGAGNGAGTTPGTTPLSPAKSGQSLQQLAAGVSKPWQAIARANGIENPRQLAAGALLNLNAGVSVGAGAAITGGTSGTASVGVSASVRVGRSSGG